jgi:hypothetical protein
MKNNLLKFIFIIFLLNTNILNAQDFYQFYKIPQYFNSAFSGIRSCSNISLTNNILPIKQGVNIISNNLLIDIYIEKISGGLFFGVSKKSMHQSVFSELNFSFGYSYHNKLSQKYRFSLSTQTKFKRSSFDATTLVFPSMISPYSSTITEHNELIYSHINKNIEFSGGFVLYSKNSYYSIFVNNFFGIYFNNEYQNLSSLSFIAENRLIQKTNRFNLSINYKSLITKYYQKMHIGGLIEFLDFEIGAFSIFNKFDKVIAIGKNFIRAIITIIFQSVIATLYFQKKHSQKKYIHTKLI